MELYLGIMSGTSLDGIDVCLVNFKNKNIVVDAIEFPFPKQLKEEILHISNNQQTTIQQIGVVDHKLGVLYAESINSFLKKSNIKSSQITVIGCHGQTVWHSPGKPYPFTIQLGDLNIIAAKTGIKTIGDFRRKDMALGGQGAPLVPAFHKYMFNFPKENRIILNIGGISNITKLYKDTEIIGYDTGPGNILMDIWIRRHLHKSYDKNGNWARGGKLNDQLLNSFLSDNFFTKMHPKSTGREKFNSEWIKYHLGTNSQLHEISPQDVQNTLTELTAISIANEINNNGLCHRVLVCGGGAFNSFLMERIQAHLLESPVESTANYGLDPSHVESAAFAWLAKQRAQNKSSNMPSVTGAKKATTLGCVIN